MNARRVTLVAAAVGLTLEALVAASTFTPAAPVLPNWVVFPLFAGVFPVHLHTVARWNRGLGRRRPPGDPTNPRWRAVPLRIRLSVGAITLAMAVVAGTGLVGLRGNPEHDASGYYLNNHGTRTPVTAPQYAHAAALQQRTFSAGPGAFYALAIAGCFL